MERVKGLRVKLLRQPLTSVRSIGKRQSAVQRATAVSWHRHGISRCAGIDVSQLIKVEFMRDKPHRLFSVAQSVIGIWLKMTLAETMHGEKRSYRHGTRFIRLRSTSCGMRGSL